MPQYPLTLGNINFDQGAFEGPDGFKDGLGDLGSEVEAVVRKYPGGIVTAQVLGSYPKPISWKGILWGATALGRDAALQQLADNLQQVTLTWARYSFDGFVKDYKSMPHGPNEIHFEIIFQPLVNNNSAAGGGQLAAMDPFAGTVSNAQQVMQQQVKSPASGYIFSGGITDGAANLNSSINQALQTSGGSVANIASADAVSIQSQVSSIQSQLGPLINGSDPIAASAAADLNGTVSMIGNAVANSTPGTYTNLTLANPNLYNLAALYYKDPTQYQAILDASGLTDPLPTGLVSITIPVLPTPGAQPVTVMSDAA